MKLAVIDVCGTLIRENTTRGFLEALASSGHRPFAIRMALSRPVSWWGSRTGFDLGRRLLVLALRGLPRTRLDAAARDYVSDRLRRHANQRLIAELAALRRGGHTIVLATATVDPVSRAIAAALAADHLVTTELAYDSSGRCTGALARDVTGRKWAEVMAWLAGREPESIVVHTDNSEDVDLMQRADQVVFHGPADAEVLASLPAGRARVEGAER